MGGANSRRRRASLPPHSQAKKERAVIGLACGRGVRGATNNRLAGRAGHRRYCLPATYHFACVVRSNGIIRNAANVFSCSDETRLPAKHRMRALLETAEPSLLL